MRLFNIPFFVFLSLLIFSYAEYDVHEFLKLHNDARAKCGVGPMKWDDKLETYAKNYANKRIDCELTHSEGPYGENICQWGDQTDTSKEVFDAWFSEIQHYDYKTNTCQPDQVCGHYTQVMWKNSTCLGCARVNCKTGGAFITCNYDPPGNYDGEKPF